MLTYSFEHRGSDSLYTYLYKQIKADILAFRLAPGEKLPSKRALSKHLGISTITVENAYNQLLAEGYIYSKPKSGFYVNQVVRAAQSPSPAQPALPLQAEDDVFADFVSSSISGFPFALWTKLMRQTMSDEGENLMVRSPSIGVLALREAIADYLHAFRGISVSSDQIVVGAGTEYLYGLIIQFLGRDRTYALEDPGYGKIGRIYRENGVSCAHIPLDQEGVVPEILERSGAEVLHISPSHHFPTGLVTPISRRYELLSWASKSPSRYIIEDDYDSEFRLQGKPIPTLQSIDVMDKVIYINTFSKSLTSTIRISYMVLPRSLMEEYNRRLSFYSCTVSTFEQYTLARFIRSGSFETHINRMRTYYRTQRDTLITAIRSHPRYQDTEILEEDAGLHFLLKVNTPLPDEALIRRARAQGINISCLSQYYALQDNAKESILVLNYAGISPEKITEAVRRLFLCLWPDTP